MWVIATVATKVVKRADKRALFPTLCRAEEEVEVRDEKLERDG